VLAFRLAWRSFVRHKRRSVITSAAIAFGLALMLWFIGISTDSHEKMIDLGIRMGAGHVIIQGKGFHEAQTLDHALLDPAPALRAARQTEGVQHIARRVLSGGLITAGDRSSAVILAGVEPRIEPQISKIASPDSRVHGDYLRRRADREFANAPADIYVGVELAESLGLALGDRVVVTASPLGSSRPASAAFSVRGVFRTGLGDIDAGMVQIPIDEAQSLLALGSGVTQIAVMLDDVGRTEAATQSIKTALAAQADSIEVLPWTEALKELYDAIVLDDMSLYLLMTIIFVIVAIGIFNTVLTSVVERTRELGVMMAIGTSRWRLFTQIMAEAVILALVASAAGIVFGYILHALVAHYGIDIGALAGGEYEVAGIAFGGKIYSQLGIEAVVKWTSIVIGIVLLSAIYPATRVSVLRPVEAMRHV
jgi:ABC-type lipoprotein release transport system permease subunit